MKEDIEKKSTSRVSGILALTAAVMITVFSGVIYARMSQQWGVEKDFEAASVALRGLPQQFGDWHLEGEHELGDSAMETVAGYRRLKVLHIAHNEIHNLYDK